MFRLNADAAMFKRSLSTDNMLHAERVVSPVETMTHEFLQRSQRLSDLLVFSRVVEMQGFSAAARALGLSKSTVSKHVHRLETGLAVTLLHRTTRKLSLTDAGRLLYAHAEPIVRLGSGAEEAMAGLSVKATGTLRMAASPAYAQHVLAPLLPEFHRRNPEVHIELRVADRFIDPVEEGVDLVVRLQDRPDESLAGRPLHACPFVVCASPDLPGLRAVGEPADLATFACLSFSRSRGVEHEPALWRFQHAQGRRASVQVAGPVTVNSSDVVRTMALNRLGVGLLPLFAVADDLANGRLVALLPEWTPEGPFGAIAWALWPPHRHMAPKLRAMIDFLVEVLGARS